MWNCYEPLLTIRSREAPHSWRLGSAQSIIVTLIRNLAPWLDFRSKWPLFTITGVAISLIDSWRSKSCTFQRNPRALHSRPSDFLPLLFSAPGVELCTTLVKNKHHTDSFNGTIPDLNILESLLFLVREKNKTINNKTILNFVCWEKKQKNNWSYLFRLSNESHGDSGWQHWQP